MGGRVNADIGRDVHSRPSFCFRLFFLSFFLCFSDKVNPDGATVAVTYIDYGNAESVNIKHLRLNPKLDILNKAPPNAVLKTQTPCSHVVKACY